MEPIPIKCSVCGAEVGVDEVAAVTFDRREVPPVFLRLCQNCFAHITSMVEWLEFKALEAPSPIDRWEDAGDCARRPTPEWCVRLSELPGPYAGTIQGIRIRMPFRS